MRFMMRAWLLAQITGSIPGGAGFMIGGPGGGAW